MRVFIGSLACLFALACDGSDPEGMGSYGDPCATAGDCESGLSCVQSPAFPGGYCTAQCADGMCEGDSDCDAASAPPLCLARCEDASDCREDYQCWRGNCRPLCGASRDCVVPAAVCGEDGRCIGPECTMDSHCASSQRCVTGMCVERPDGGGVLLPIGSPCTDAIECESGACLPSALGGMCTIQCTRATDCFDTTFESACSAVPFDGNGDGSSESVLPLCAPLPAGSSPIGSLCSSDVDCEARICHAGQCTEVCAEDTNCLPGQRCRTLLRAAAGDAIYSGCGYSDRVSAIQIDEFDLGETDLLASRGADFEIATPPDAISITIQSRQISGDPLELTFVQVIDARETTIFDVLDIFDLVDPDERWLPVDTGENITMLVPNTTADRVPFVPGVYRFSISPIPREPDDPGSIRFGTSVLVKRADVGVGGVLDLNVYFVGVGVTASEGRSNGRVDAMLDRLEDILGDEAAISLGSIDFFDITGSDATAFSTISTTDGPDSELAELFRLSAPRSGRAHNIFLVRAIDRDSDGSFRALGVAGGIPGPVGIHGSQHSGVVAVFDSAIVSGTVVGHILSHEIGHYLGLFHATEANRPCGVGETPEDGCSPFGGGDPIRDTELDDFDNLMYWSIVGDGENDQLSPGQSFVCRMSALVGP
jgi:hypothetical protein